MGRPQIVYKTPNEDRSLSFIHYFASRVLDNNKNFLCAVTGPTGAGKSWLCGSIAERYAKIYGINYDPKVHTIFSIKDLLDLINRKDLDKVLPAGSVIMFDEPQVSVNARDWRSEANQILSTLTSTFRNMRLIVFFATPYLEFIDKQSRILFHAEIEVIGFDKTTNYTLCKPRFLQWNARKGDFYKKRLVIRYPVDDKDVLNWYYLQYWEMYKPTKEWIEAYEEQKIAFTKKLNRELKQQYEFMQSQHNKGRDLVLLSDLYDKHGLDYKLFAEALPHVTPYALERLVAMLRKQKKEEEKIEKQRKKIEEEEKKLLKKKEKEMNANKTPVPIMNKNSEIQALPPASSLINST